MKVEFYTITKGVSTRWYWKTSAGETNQHKHVQGHRSKAASKRHYESTLVSPVVLDRNAGNSANTYYKPRKANDRPYCLHYEASGSYARDKNGRVRRFKSAENARGAAYELFLKSITENLS